MRAPTSSQPQEEGETCDNQAEGDDDRSDGCFKFAGQVLGGRQLRLPASFQRASSLPRRFARSVAPTPEGREPQVRASARAQLGAESSDVELKSSKKRAASTSPSRNEFRRSFKDRIPRQLRSLIPARMMPGYNLPPRPTRKAGPVGRTWVKVYDDITYMDDTSQEYYPIVGYTGAPVKVPEANPLPRAPTPPPPPRQRTPRRVSPTPSQLSEYDNVPRNEESVAVERNGSQKDTDQELILQEISNNRMRKMNEEASPEERQEEADRELILKELTLKQMNGEKELPQSDYENSIPVERPTARKRENTRFKGRRQKRSGTPVATDRMANGFNDENVIDSGNQTFETIEYTKGESMKISVLEDEYIIPERKSSPPPRPKRGTKIYEGVNTLEKQTPQKTDSAVIAINGEQTKVSDSNDIREPTRPVRGVKVYETVHVSKTEVAPEIMEQENRTKDTPVEGQDKIEQKEKEESNEIKAVTAYSSTEENAAATVKPVKPKRGVKVYEDIILSSESTPKGSSVQISNEEKLVPDEISLEPSTVSESTAQEGVSVEPKPREEPSSKEDTKLSEITSDLSDKPSKPQRGIKLYEDVAPLTPCITNTSTEERIKPSKPERGPELYEDVIVKETCDPTAPVERIVSDSKEIEVPSKPERGKKVYSGLDFSDKQKPTDDKCCEGRKQNEGIPPYATVQKNRDSHMQYATVGDNNAPPPIPPKKRARQVATSNEGPEVIPPRPARHLKPRDRSAEAIRSPKRQKTNTQAGETAQAPPQKPTRSSGSKSKVKAEPIIGKVTLESGRTPEMSITKLDTESYENMILSDPHMKFKSRPLPPTPGQTADEGTILIGNTSSPSLCPPGTPAGSDAPSAQHTSLIITANDDSQGRNEAPQAHLTNANSTSTADGVEVRGAVRDSVASNGLESSPEVINVNTNITELPLETSESAVQSLKGNIGPNAAEESVQNNIVRGERTRTCEYCGHPTLDNSLREANITSDHNADDVINATNINVVQASLQFRGNIDGESTSQEGVSVECIQTPCFLTAVTEPTEAECTELKTTDNKATDKTLVENSATEEEILSEELNSSNITVGTESLTECVVVQDDNKPLTVTAVLEKTDRKLSVAAETTIGFEECVAETLPRERSNSDQCQIQSKLDNERKLSVAAESVEANIVPESTESLILSSPVESEKLQDGLDPKTGSDRRLSVAAETVIVNFVPESAEILPSTSSEIKENVAESTSKSFPEGKLSVAAESIASNIAETVGVEENKNIAADIEVSMHSGDPRKMSIAAESITVESTPESTQALDTSVIGQGMSCASAESAVASVVAGEQSTPEKNERKISVAAETLSLAIPESIQVFNPSASDQENVSVNVEPVTADALTSVDDHHSEEIGRKISIAAETVALEFMPETTETLNRENLETVNVVATDENGASSVAAVSVTTGSFADTVTNKPNENITTGVQPLNAVTEASADVLTQLPGNVQESGLTSLVNAPADSSYTAEQSQETSNLMESKAPDSLSGSQTSITDDDSVVSVVTKAELGAKAELGESGKEPTNISSDSCDPTKPADVTATAASIEMGESILKGRVTDINDRLEGISNFLDSIVRNFSPMQVDDANDTFRQSDSSPSVGPISTSSTNNSTPACSVSIGVSATPELPLTNCETDNRYEQTRLDSQLESRDNADVKSSRGTLIQPALQEQTSSHSEVPASLSCANSPSTSIEASAADGAVPAVSKGTVSPDQKYPSVEAFREDIVAHKDPDASASTIHNLEKCEEELESSTIKSCINSTESKIANPQTAPSVFDLLDSGLGFPGPSVSEPGSVLMFLDGEWHTL